MIDLGGPIIPGKAKEAAKSPLANVKIISISMTLLKDKLNFQDIPMLCILLVHFIVSLSSQDSSGQKIGLAYIGITTASVLSGYVSSRWARDSKRVDLHAVIKIVQDRQAEVKKRREDAAHGANGEKPGGIKLTDLSVMEPSSDDTDRSEASSNGLNDVMEEVMQLCKEKGLGGPIQNNNDTSKIPILHGVGGGDDQLSAPSPRGSAQGAFSQPTEQLGNSQE